MRVPRRIKLGPWDITIEQGVETDLNLRGLMGDWEECPARIRIMRNLAPSMERETVMHEVLHAVFAMNGLQQEWGEEKEEAVVRRLSPVLLAAMRDNPRLVAFLIEKDAPSA